MADTAAVPRAHLRARHLGLDRRHADRDGEEGDERSDRVDACFLSTFSVVTFATTAGALGYAARRHRPTVTWPRGSSLLSGTAAARDDGRDRGHIAASLDPNAEAGIEPLRNGHVLTDGGSATTWRSSTPLPQVPGIDPRLLVRHRQFGERYLLAGMARAGGGGRVRSSTGA